MIIAIGEIETYQLNKRQSIAVAARLNTALLMRIIDRWQGTELYRQEIEERKYNLTNQGE